MPSEDYERFIWSCFPKDFHAWREGLDTQALVRLSGNEREQAKALLLSEVNGFLNEGGIEGYVADAYRVVEAIGWLELEEGIQPLERLLELGKKRNDYALRAKIGLALHRIVEFPEGAALASDLLDKTPQDSQWWRLEAVDHLGAFATKYKAAARKLLHTIDDKDTFVAFCACERLISIFQAHKQISDALTIIKKTPLDHRPPIPNAAEIRQDALRAVTALIESELRSDTQWK